MKENIMQKKSFEVATRIANPFRYLQSKRKEYILSRQFLRPRTIIKANAEQASGGQSKSAFLAKISTSYKEAIETIYYVKLLTETINLEEKEADHILKDLERGCKVLATILASSKQSNSQILIPIRL